jgi:NADH dehydrogenase/NADH:ubiquinone oxidoreductase subunit G
VTLTIDGRPVNSPRGRYVLQAARSAGIEIPTLCDHSALDPIGACRLCMVEITHPNWGGWSGLMIACLYPVSEGIQVQTRSPRVLDARRGVLALLAARCPASSRIQRLARQYGASPSALGLAVDPAADTCILCGLCTRVCAAYATAAIATTGRGSRKRVATFADAAPEDCVGCGACAMVCPTDNIVARRSGGRYAIWERTFIAAPAEVDPARCIGCGICEEACPFSVARVAVRVGGVREATITRDHCWGCGVCVAACPSAAISQTRPYDWEGLVGRLERPGASGGAT